MTLGVARVTDICSGHDGFQPRHSISGSGDVFCEGLPVHRLGDQWEVHTNTSSHDSILASGSPTVFVNGLPIGRITDQIECGSTVASGSSTVFSG